MDSSCVTLKPNVHVQNGSDCVKNGFWGKKINHLATNFCKYSRIESKKIKKLGVTHFVLKSPVDEEILVSTKAHEFYTVRHL